MRIVIPVLAAVLANPMISSIPAPSKGTEPMNLCETTRDSDGQTRYYAGGRRITRERMREIKSDNRLDTFQTVVRGGYTRQHCVARVGR